MNTSGFTLSCIYFFLALNEHLPLHFFGSKYKGNFPKELNFSGCSYLHSRARNFKSEFNFQFLLARWISDVKSGQ